MTIDVPKQDVVVKQCIADVFTYEIDFEVAKKADFLVYFGLTEMALLIETVDYNVIIIGDGGFDGITLIGDAAIDLTAEHKIAFKRIVGFSQGQNYSEFYDQVVLENQLDEISTGLADLRRDVGNGLQFPILENSPNFYHKALPNLRANKILSFDADGNPEAVVESGDINVLAEKALEAVQAAVDAADSKNIAVAAADSVVSIGTGILPVATMELAKNLANLAVGMRLRIEDRANSTWKVVESEDVAAGFSLVQSIATPTLKLSLIKFQRMSSACFGVKADGVTDDTLATIAAMHSGVSWLTLPAGNMLISNITHPPSLLKLEGSGGGWGGSVFVRKSGSNGAMYSQHADSRLINVSVKDIYFIGSSEDTETYLLDLSGFSYSHFENLYCRLAYLDGIYSNGEITPTNRQYSNNSFLNVRSNNNLRDGFRFEDTYNSNTANTYVQCEGAGNGEYGWKELAGDSNEVIGCVFQGNGNDFYSNGTNGRYSFYAEGNFKTVTFGSESKKNNATIRSSYPIWSTFQDNGVQNSLSVRGEEGTEVNLFDNPYFSIWLSTLPEKLNLNGTPQITSVLDSASVFGKSIEISFDANFQGIIFSSLTAAPSDLAGRWVTLIIDMDTSGIVDDVSSRIYARDDTTGNSSNGSFFVGEFDITPSGKFKKFYFDVRFDDVIAGNPNLILYLGYSGVTVANVIKIRSAHIVLGQTQIATYIPDNSDKSVNTATLLDVSSGINSHLKKGGQMVYETSTGKMRFTIGSAPTSAWRATDGSGDLVPS